MRKPRKSWGRIQAFGKETPALVGVITRQKDWRILETEHWYRIPVKSAPEELPKAKYLAFYQTKVFGDEKWAVNWYTQVKGIIAMKRIELLPDEPKHKRAQAAYYRVAIGGLRHLPYPIPSRRWRRIVFIPTSLERLFAAEEINDLFKTSPIEDRLYFRMKDAGLDAERQFFVRESETGYMLDMALFCSDGNLDIECDGELYHSGKEARERDRSRDNALTSDGWRILRFSGKQILDYTGQCLRVVRKTVKKLGGIGKGKSGPKRTPASEATGVKKAGE
ncbi:hypothetical protein CH330_06890 [candidate division WOR-3 bacterium JGI_Cruoil_03_51_56]|uniref:Restriction endonuclease type II-like domain-containing protein n=1 Tax=candidate division WOR-3 bacterium JGI_Cruoil_03_51_56 TaxID=1973747 RepID=A0A235BRN7_UNCW3|nr:MAG: hypothetical protein CH330_06890 [candidate division WOR-3 bacterium JGI_Cruoil_03_51_56]